MVRRSYGEGMNTVLGLSFDCGFSTFQKLSAFFSNCTPFIVLKAKMALFCELKGSIIPNSSKLFTVVHLSKLEIELDIANASLVIFTLGWVMKVYSSFSIFTTLKSGANLIFISKFLAIVTYCIRPLFFFSNSSSKSYYSAVGNALRYCIYESICRSLTRFIHSFSNFSIKYGGVLLKFLYRCLSYFLPELFRSWLY